MFEILKMVWFLIRFFFPSIFFFFFFFFFFCFKALGFALQKVRGFDVQLWQSLTDGKLLGTLSIEIPSPNSSESAGQWYNSNLISLCLRRNILIYNPNCTWFIIQITLHFLKDPLILIILFFFILNDWLWLILTPISCNNFCFSDEFCRDYIFIFAWIMKGRRLLDRYDLRQSFELSMYYYFYSHSKMSSWLNLLLTLLFLFSRDGSCIINEFQLQSAGSSFWGWLALGATSSSIM